jgi:hypothetical protein
LNLIRVMPAKGRTTMTNSKLIAGLVGPLLAAIGIAMLINRNLIPAVIGEAAHNDALVFLSGLLALLAGVAIVRVHNLWIADWRLLLTVIGWLAVFSGIVRLWNPHGAARIAMTLAGSATGLLVSALVVLVLGVFLSFKAYGTQS